MFLAATVTVFLAAACAQQQNVSEPDFATWSTLKQLYASSNAPLNFNSDAPCDSRAASDFEFACDNGELSMLAFPCCAQFVMPELSYLTRLTALSFLPGGANRVAFTQRFLAEPLPRLQLLTFANAPAVEFATELGRFTALKSLVAVGAFVDGAIPSQLGLLKANLTLLNISSNRFSNNVVPSQLALLTSLRALNLTNNKLQGSIALGAMTDLWSLQLYGNSFSRIALDAVNNSHLQFCTLYNGVLPDCALKCPHSCSACHMACDCGLIASRCTSSPQVSAVPTTPPLFVGTAFRASVGITVAIGLSMLTLIGLVGLALCCNCWQLRRAQRGALAAAVDD